MAFQVLTNRDLLLHITSFQPGKPGKEWTCGWKAVMAGHLPLVQYIHARHLNTFFQTSMDFAARNGRLDIVQWLHVNRSEGCTTQAMDLAARGGHLEVLCWLHVHRTEGCTIKAMDGAVGMGHLNVVQWLHANRSEGCSTSALLIACNTPNHLPLVQYLYNSYPHMDWGVWTTEGSLLDFAAKHGDFDAVKWMHEHLGHLPNICSRLAISYAANSGHLEMVIWFYQNYPECQMTFECGTMDQAAKKGHLAIVKWLYENALPYDDAEGRRQIINWGIRGALNEEHLNVVKFLMETPDEKDDADFMFSLIMAIQAHAHGIVAYLNTFIPLMANKDLIVETVNSMTSR